MEFLTFRSIHELMMLKNTQTAFIYRVSSSSSLAMKLDTKVQESSGAGTKLYLRVFHSHSAYHTKQLQRIYLF